MVALSVIASNPIIYPLLISKLFGNPRKKMFDILKASSVTIPSE